MTCTACGTRNPDGRKFCGECGMRLALACTACGASLDGAQKFCGECGQPISQPIAGTLDRRDGSGTTQPVAERRLVSVLFADLVGFTPFSEERDAEEVRETLSRYFDVARAAVDHHGGTVEKFIGDAVMAVWGTPTAREDDAERAVRAALELVDAVRGLGPGIDARAGVLTGEAAVTLGATDQGMVAGDLVNTAARLQAAAAPGTVLVGEATFRAASAAIAFEETRPLDLKGKAAPVAAWRALRVVAELGGRGRSDLLEAPFVGRDEELRLLKELFHVTSRERRARLVSVTGPAGIGKSRLAWEFEKYIDGVVETVWWHHGRSPAYGQGVTFWALGEMIRTRCGVAETDDEATTRANVAAALTGYLPDPAERAWVEPAILALLGFGAAPATGDELFARWRLLFERLAESGTVALVFEDLHWADAGTFDFIDHLLDWAKAIPLLIVTLARPEILDQRPDWGGGRRSFVSVPLDPLPEPAIRAILAGLVPDLPGEAVTRIVARAEGIPLYAVETVRMLVTDKRLVLDGSVYVPAGDIATLAVPETLTALIAARLDTLDPIDRSLILDAAVLGQRFTLDGLAAVSGMDPEALEPRLRGLVRGEILGLEADARSPERGQYGFVQALIREVAYNTLAHRDRRERHLAAARHFEAMGSDELAGALAGHYLAAHANAADGPEADALAAQARIALRGAAERAMALGSNAQAAGFLRQALTVSPGAADQADLQERLGSALAPAAQYSDAATALEAALRLRLEQGDRHAAARVQARLGECLATAKRTSEARRVLEDGIATFDDLADDPSVIAMRGQLARAYALDERPRDAIALVEAVLEHAEHAGLSLILADALITKGTALASLGRPREAVAVIQLGGRIADEGGHVWTRFRALNNEMVVITDIDPRRAYRAMTEGLELARKVGSTDWTRNFVGNLGYNAYRVGEWDHAEREMRAILEEDLEPGDVSLVLSNLISIVALRGESTEAMIADMTRACESLEPDAGRALLDDALATVAFVAGRYADAATEWRIAAGDGLAVGAPSLLAAATAAVLAGDADGARQAIEAFEPLHQRPPGMLALRDGLLAAIAALDGAPDGVLERMREARERLAGLGLAEDAARLAITTGSVLDPRDPAVAEEVRAARAFYAGVRAVPMVALCDRLLGESGERSDASEPTVGTEAAVRAAAGSAADTRDRTAAEELAG